MLGTKCWPRIKAAYSLIKFHLSIKDSLYIWAYSFKIYTEIGIWKVTALVPCRRDLSHAERESGMSFVCHLRV